MNLNNKTKYWTKFQEDSFYVQKITRDRWDYCKCSTQRR